MCMDKGLVKGLDITVIKGYLTLRCLSYVQVATIIVVVFVMIEE